MHESLDEFEFGQIIPLTTELSVFERLKINVITFSRLLLTRSFLNSQVMKTCIIFWMSSNLGQVGPSTLELAALDRSKIFQYTYNGGTSSSHFLSCF